MDATFGFSGVNRSSNAFQILGNSTQSPGTECIADTTLSLNYSIPHIPASRGLKRKWSIVDEPTGHHIDSSLSLELGLSSSSSDSKGSLATTYTMMSPIKNSDDESSMDIDLEFTLSLDNEKTHSVQKAANLHVKRPQLEPKVGLELSLSTGQCNSNITSIQQFSADVQLGGCIPMGISPTADEGSRSSCWEPRISSISPETSTHVLRKDNAPALVQNLTPSAMIVQESSVTCASGITQQQKPQIRSSNSKLCQVEGCQKGARGASGRCISHGGGRRCQKLGCQKGAEGRTVFCKAHGGGRRCEFLGCTKSAEGPIDFCIAHGGGRRCSHEGCTRASRGKSGLCIRHGGGKRCQRENCTRSAEGLSGLCISHGGGRRCQFHGCTKGAQGSTMFCKAHGGGKRCTYPGCSKGAEGSTAFCKGHGGGRRCAFQGGGVCTKSVHGGTNFCVAHGGGKRCAVPDCTKSARGKTDFCVRHGGGKRCKIEECQKSAQGSTDYCKAHGGGKRCAWGHPDTEFYDQTSGPCDSFARGKLGLCAIHGGLVQDRRVHGGSTLGPMIPDPTVKNKTEKMKGLLAVEEEMNMDISGCSKACSSLEHSSHRLMSVSKPGFLCMQALEPEGRVHGGSLMAMLSAGPPQK